MSAISDTVRASFKEGDDVRDAGLETPDDIVRFDDIAYGDDAMQVLDVYRPTDGEGERLPVIVSVHGGGWVYGDKERYQYYCMSLAQHGFAVVNFSYRLAPEHKFPASLEDTNAVFAWVLAHGDEYLFDLDHICAVGDSAGAHMLAIYAIATTDAAYAARIPLTPPADLALTAVALNCGAYKIETHEPVNDPMLDLTSSLMADFLPGGGTPDELELISPLLHVTDAFPPAFIMTADGDFLRPDALPFVHALDEHGIEVCYHYYRSDELELGHVFHCNMRLAEASQANADECAFFHAHC